MFTAPKVENRPAQNYVGIRTEASINQLPTVIPQLIGELYDWLGKHGVAPAGGPFNRFHVINMETAMDIELGLPVASPVKGDGRVFRVIPAGRYASLVYTGVQNAYPGNKILIDWGVENGMTWDTYPSDKGDGFVSRVEFFLSGPQDDPDPGKWDTEVAIKLADK